MNCFRCDTPANDRRNRVIVTVGKRQVPQHRICPRAGVEEVRLRQAHIEAQERKRYSA